MQEDSSITLRPIFRVRVAIIGGVGVFFLLTSCLSAAGAVRKLGNHLYAYISDNDGSSNSTFLIGPAGILVVDTGLNSVEGEKLLRQIRKISPLPVEYILNTHYHPDHQGGNATVGPHALVLSTEFTRTRTLTLMRDGEFPSSFRPATLTFTKKITIHMGDNPVEIYSLGAAHTGGDAIAYFPRQQVVSTGDVYITGSCPDIDPQGGNVAHWIKVLGFVLSLRATTFVPGHFSIGSRAQVERFRDYLSDLYAKVRKMYQSGEGIEAARKIEMGKYSDFRQFPNFHATFADNAAEVYRELASAHRGGGQPH